MSANGNSIRVQDVGNDHLRVAPDGTVTISIVGQVPFQFSGASRINVTTGEVFHEPHHIVDIDAVCSRLAA